jgi:hypothetical protein
VGYRSEFERITAHPAASGWLKDAMAALDKCDPIAAAGDLEFLRRLTDIRLRELGLYEEERETPLLRSAEEELRDRIRQLERANDRLERRWFTAIGLAIVPASVVGWLWVASGSLTVAIESTMVSAFIFGCATATYAACKFIRHKLACRRWARNELGTPTGRIRTISLNDPRRHHWLSW